MSGGAQLCYVFQLEAEELNQVGTLCYAGEPDLSLLRDPLILPDHAIYSLVLIK